MPLVRFKDRADFLFAILLDQFWQARVGQSITNHVAVGFNGQWRSVEDRIAGVSLEVGFTPGVGNDVVVVEIVMLGNVRAHPIASTLHDQQAEDSVVEGTASF